MGYIKFKQVDTDLSVTSANIIQCGAACSKELSSGVSSMSS